MTTFIEVLCPNGHRVSCKTTPNTKLIQVLEEACNKKGFLPCENYTLKHGKKTLDLSESVRFSGIVNRALLDLIKTDAPRSNDAHVTVALQLENGQRIMHSCPGSTTLWNFVISCSEMINGPKSEDIFGIGNKHPVLVYVREEIIGRFALQHTTFKKLGLVGGRASMRLMFREIDDEVLHAIGKKIEEALRKEEQMQIKGMKLNKENSYVETKHEVISQVSHYSSSVQSSNLLTSSHDEPMDICEPLPSRIFPEEINPVDRRFMLEPMMIPETIPQPFIEFKFPENTKGTELYQNNLSDFKRHEYEECEREAVLFAKEDSMIDSNKNISDEFFEVTKDDIRRMYNDLRKSVSAFDEMPLMTNTMKQQAIERRLECYTYCILRFQFPSKHILQGIFRPRESIHAVEKFVASHIKKSESSFYLYTTPPRVLLKDKSKLIYESNFLPMSLVYVGSENPSDLKIKSDIHLTNRLEADRIVEKYMVKLTETTTEVMSYSHKRPSLTASPLEPTPKAPISKDSGSKDTPKWFKAGIKK